MKRVLLGLGIVVIAAVTALAVIAIARPGSTPTAGAAPASNPASNATPASPPTQLPSSSTPPAEPTATTPTSATTAGPTPIGVGSSAVTSPAGSAHLIRPRHPVPSLPPAAQSDPIAVATSYVQTLATIDTVSDVDRTDAASRAAYLMTPTLTAATTRHPTAGPDTQWQSWHANHAYTTVTTIPINIPWAVADSKVSATRAIGYVVTVHTADGTTTPQPQQTLAVTMVRASEHNPWRVNATEIP